MPPPVVDISSLYGVESLFRHGTKDPWGKRLAGRLADLFIFSETCRYTMPVRGGVGTTEDPSLPPVLNVLRSRDSGIFVPLPYFSKDRPRIDIEHLEPAFRSFANWATNNKASFQQWITLHQEIRNNPSDLSRVRAKSVFDISRLCELPIFQLSASQIGVRPDDLVYAFDIVLRYPLYGELAGVDSFFLAHPIREQQAAPILSVGTGTSPRIPISLSAAVAEMVSRMSLDEYTSFLHEARGLIRDLRIDQLQPGAIDRETTREIAIQLGLPARLSRASRVIGIAAGVVGITGAIPAAGPAAKIAGGLLTIGSAIWDRSVGRSLGQVSWLRWAFEWDLENQASDAPKAI
jgi:hypothetical protein